MGKTIVITGRGGTGKTTFTALAARFLQGSKLLIDADPDQCLGVMLGVDLPASGVRTVSEALYEIQKGQLSPQMKAMPLAEKVEYLLQLSCLYESKQFDLLTLGVKWTRGCYCAPNDILRALIPRLAGAYEVTIVDSPAGLEHINRRVVTQAHDVFAVVDPSGKALRNAELVRSLSGPQIAMTCALLAALVGLYIGVILAVRRLLGAEPTGGGQITVHPAARGDKQ